MPNKLLCGELVLETNDTPIHIADKYWFEPGRKFDIGTPKAPKLVTAPCKKRPGKLGPRMVVLHWTGGEGGIDRFTRTLLQNRVSAHLFVERDGTVHQLADLWDTETYHAKSAGGVVNARSIGIEIQCIGIAKVGQTDRGIYKDTVLGKELSMACFTLAQVDAVMDILDTLIEAGIIERTFPRVPKVDPNSYDSILRTKMTDGALKTFRGACGHYHIPGSTKLDPGTQLFKIAIDEGW